MCAFSAAEMRRKRHVGLTTDGGATRTAARSSHDAGEAGRTTTGPGQGLRASWTAKRGSIVSRRGREKSARRRLLNGTGRARPDAATSPPAADHPSWPQVNCIYYIHSTSPQPAAFDSSRSAVYIVAALALRSPCPLLSTGVFQLLL